MKDCNIFIQITATAIREAFALSQHSYKQQHPLLPSQRAKQTGTAERWPALVHSASRLADQRTLNTAYCTPRK